MPHFHLSHGAIGPLIDVWIAPSAVRQRALQLEGKPIPNPVLAKALIDTGASHTVVDIGIITQLDLAPTGTMDVITPSTGATPCQQLTYDLAIFVPLSKPYSQPWAFPFWVASAAELQHQGFGVLFGRDLLGRSTFFYDGQAQLFTLSF